MDLVERSQVRFDATESVCAGPIAGVNPLRALASVGKIALGVVQSLLLLRRNRPDAILMTGGWANIPLALAARLMRLPVVVYLPDVEPGTAIRFLSRFADTIAVTTPASRDFLPDRRVEVVGYPLRRNVRTATREAANQHFNLDTQRPLLLVFGGSRGARSINIAVQNIVPQLLADGWQILHILGTLDADRAEQIVAALDDSRHYHPYAYVDEMGLALAAADLAVARAGASTLGEFPYFGLPSLLVPYPYAWHYQKVNADYLVDRGAAVRVDDDDMAADLLPLIRTIRRDEARYRQMRERALALRTEDSAQQIATLLLRYNQGQPAADDAASPVTASPDSSDISPTDASDRPHRSVGSDQVAQSDPIAHPDPVAEPVSAAGQPEVTQTRAST